MSRLIGLVLALWDWVSLMGFVSGCAPVPSRVFHVAPTLVSSDAQAPLRLGVLVNSLSAASLLLEAVGSSLLIRLR